MACLLGSPSEAPAWGAGSGQGGGDRRTCPAWSDLLGSGGPDFPDTGDPALRGGEPTEAAGWLPSCFGKRPLPRTPAPPPPRLLSWGSGALGAGEWQQTAHEPRGQMVTAATDTQARVGDGAVAAPQALPGTATSRMQGGAALGPSPWPCTVPSGLTSLGSGHPSHPPSPWLLWHPPRSSHTDLSWALH